MKKILIALLAGISFASFAQAATFFSDYGNSFAMNQTRQLFPFAITATAESEITAEHGINFLLDPEAQLLWDNVSPLTASGTAVTAERILASITPEYQKDYSILHIPVTADFEVGESVTINGIGLRAYRHPFREKYIQIDINGDLVGDVTDNNKVEVQDILNTDFTPPYPPTDVMATLSSDLKSIKLTWHPSPDYDSLGTIIDRKRVRGDNTLSGNLLNNGGVVEYIDTDILPGDMLTYTLYANDGRNLGETAEKTVEVKAAAAETPPVTEKPPLTETEQLSNLYTSYKVRYSIKCHPAGRVVSENDSACLWSKIDIIYAQEKLGKSEVSVSLSARDKELMALRQKWPQQRYQAACVDAATPAKNCSALGKAIERVHYFLEQK